MFLSAPHPLGHRAPASIPPPQGGAALFCVVAGLSIGLARYIHIAPADSVR